MRRSVGVLCGEKCKPVYRVDSYPCRTGKRTHAGMWRAAAFAMGYPYALKCGMRKYFEHIDPCESSNSSNANGADDSEAGSGRGLIDPGL